MLQEDPARVRDSLTVLYQLVQHAKELGEVECQYFAAEFLRPPLLFVMPRLCQTYSATLHTEDSPDDAGNKAAAAVRKLVAEGADIAPNLEEVFRELFSSKCRARRAWEEFSSCVCEAMSLGEQE